MWRACAVGVLYSSVAFAQGAVAVPYDDDEPRRPADPAYVARQRNYRDTSVTIEGLPIKKVKWAFRKSVRFGGVVPVALCGAHNLQLIFVGPVRRRDDAAMSQRFEVLPSSEPAEGGNCFPAMSLQPGDKGPIHAAVRVRPASDSPESERVQVVIYNPPARRDIVLVATRGADDTEWTPLMYIDMPKATRIEMITPGWH